MGTSQITEVSNYIRACCSGAGSWVLLWWRPRVASKEVRAGVESTTVQRATVSNLVLLWITACGLHNFQVSFATSSHLNRDPFLMSSPEMHMIQLCFCAYCRLAQRTKSGGKCITYLLVTKTFSINWTLEALPFSIYTYLHDLFPDKREFCHITKPVFPGA